MGNNDFKSEWQKKDEPFILSNTCIGIIVMVLFVLILIYNI